LAPLKPSERRVQDDFVYLEGRIRVILVLTNRISQQVFRMQLYD
jgi:hypothetical protein